MLFGNGQKLSSNQQRKKWVNTKIFFFYKKNITLFFWILNQILYPLFVCLKKHLKIRNPSFFWGGDGGRFQRIEKRRSRNKSISCVEFGLVDRSVCAPEKFICFKGGFNCFIRDRCAPSYLRGKWGGGLWGG